MAPQVSVILPTHNRADIVRFAIESALVQTLTDFELLIVGDGCTDHTAEVVRKYDDRRVVWFDYPKSPHFGYVNRNRAIREARGDLVAYLGHDDLWFPDHLERLVACFAETDVDIAYSMPLAVSRAGLIEPHIFNLHDGETMRLWLMNDIGNMPLSCVIHRRGCLDEVGSWDERLPTGGDWDLWKRIMAAGRYRNFAYLPVPTTLSFVANWRTESWRRGLWTKVRALEGFGGPALELASADGLPEQAAAWHAISEDPVRWMRTMRPAVQVDLDRRATHRFALSGVLLAARRWTRMRKRALPLDYPADDAPGGRSAGA